MNAAETYGYLIRARRDLRSTLLELPEESLSRPLLEGTRFQCLKDLLFHIADVEDGWIHGDILREDLVQQSFPELFTGGPDFSGFPLALLLDYWRAVETSTLSYLAALKDDDLKRIVPVEDWPGRRFTLDGLLSHVMIHEMRHTAQICVLLRMQGIEPPSLDLLFYLP